MHLADKVAQANLNFKCVLAGIISIHVRNLVISCWSETLIGSYTCFWLIKKK